MARSSYSSPTSSPVVYWASSAGALAVGIVLIVYSGFRLFQEARISSNKHVSILSAFGIAMFCIALFMMLFALFSGTCSHQ